MREEPAGCDEILSYKGQISQRQRRQGRGAKTAGMSSLKRRCPADIPEELAQRVRHLAVDTFRAPGLFRRGPDRFPQRHPCPEHYGSTKSIPSPALSFYLWGGSGPAL